jgi:alkylation response protein AidB-like acyl-CoA dehydrogenase
MNLNINVDLGLDLEFEPEQQAIAEALSQFCADRCDEAVVKAMAGRFPSSLWSELAELGVLAAGTPEGEGGALEICAAMESLGAAVFPGPLSTTFLAGQVLDGDERARVGTGEWIVSAGSPPLMPWPEEARIFLEIAGGTLHRLEVRKTGECHETLGGDRWGDVEAERGEALPGATRGLALCEMARAAYLTGAGAHLTAEAVEHAATRRQFGRAIGDFQAVAHPLADCDIHLESSRQLSRRAAWRFDQGDFDRALREAAAARLSAAAASLESVYTCHQVFGAIGITLEGPAFHISRRIRQLASEAPAPEFARALMLDSIGLEPSPHPNPRAEGAQT